MKKILFIHHSGSLGGAGVNVKYIANVLKTKYEVVTYCPTEPKDLSKYLHENDIDVKEYQFNPGYISYYNGSNNIFSSPFISGIMGIIKNKNKWKEIIEKEKPDLVLVNSKILSWFSILTSQKKLNQYAT